MTRQWDTQAGREAIEKLRRDNAIMRTTLEQISTYCDGYQAGNHAEQTLAECDAPLNADAVLGGEPAVDAESVPTPDMPERAPFMIGVEALDAIKAGVGCEVHGRTPTIEDLQTLESGD